MGVRDLVILVVFYSTLPLTLVRPFVGLLTFSWLAYMRPQDLSWTLSNARFSYLVSLALIVGLALHWKQEKLITVRPQTILLIALLVWVALTTLTAVDPDVTSKRFNLFSKIIFISVLTTGLIGTRERYRYFVLVVGFSLGLLGAKYGLYGLTRGGSEFVEGPGGFMGDRNGFALALTMALPLLGGIFLVDRKFYMRFGAFACAALTVLAIIFTFSRTGFLALGIVLLLFALRSGRPLLVPGLIIACFLIFSPQLRPELRESYAQRLQSISKYETESSAQGRLTEWKTGLLIIQDYPITGVGPDNLKLIHKEYSSTGRYKVSHNTYLQFAIECGLPGVVLFVVMILVTLLRLQFLQMGADPWLRTHCRMLQISLVAFLIGASFLDRAYYDLTYHLIAMSVCLEVVASESAGDDTAITESTDDREAWWKQLPKAKLETS